MIVVEKNYRLQDIQLSKIRRRCLRQLRRDKAAFANSSSSQSQQAITGLPSRSRFRLASVSGQAPAAKAGGEYRARTGDLLVANQALSQLS